MQRGRELNTSPCSYSHINIHWEFTIQSLRREKKGCSGPWDAEASFPAHLSTDFQR